MKKTLLLSIMCLMVTLFVKAQSNDTVQLPYTADFTQGWTASGGAVIIDSNHASINAPGQRITSPWMTSEYAKVYVSFKYHRCYGDYWSSADSATNIREIIELEDGTVVNDYWGEFYQSWSGGEGYCYVQNQRFRVIFENTGTNVLPMLHIHDIFIYSYPIEASIEAPSTAMLGDTVDIVGHVSYLIGDAVSTSWYMDSPDGGWHYIGDGDSLFTVVAQTDSLRTLVWHSPGLYRINFMTYHNVAINHTANSDAYHYITILDTVDVDCNSLSLPYSADFTQCWTATGGATIIDANHAAITHSGQKITSSWMQSVAGRTFLDWSMQMEGECDYSNEYCIVIEDENGIVQQWYDNVGPWSRVNPFNSPGGRIRVSFEYLGTTTVPSFQISDVAIFNYDIENTLETPGIARVGDTVTFVSHATLQNGGIPDSYGWQMFDPDGNLMGASNPARTILSQTDSTLVVVLHTTGRFYITSSVWQFSVFQNHSVYAEDRQYIDIRSRVTYIEDSIYYTSATKDSVSGCHPALHNANLPESVRVITDYAFYNLDNLSSVSLPDGLTHIGKRAFALNQGITEVAIPRGVQFVDDNAFGNCINLTTIHFNAEDCQIMSCVYPVFYGCDNVTTIKIGENVTRIPDCAFSSCKGLRDTIVIPDQVTYIGSAAFYSWVEDSPMLTVVLGRSVSEIGNSAFPGFYGRVNHVISLNPVPPMLQWNSFYTMPDSSRVTVPCGSTEAYLNGAYWNEFIIEEDCSTSIDDMPSADEFSVSVMDGRIVIEGVCGEAVSVFDVMGRNIATKAIEGDGVSISVTQSGVYVVKVGTLPARKVVVIR